MLEVLTRRRCLWLFIFVLAAGSHGGCKSFYGTIIKSSKKASGKGFVTNPHTVQFESFLCSLFASSELWTCAPLFYRVNEVNTGFSNQTPLFLLAHIGRCWCLCDLTHIPFCSAHHDLLYHRYEPIIDSHSFDSLMDSVDILPLSIAWPLSCSWFLSELGVPFCQPDTFIIVVLVPYWSLPWCHYSWWMCATRVMWILLELWFVCSIVCFSFYHRGDMIPCVMFSTLLGRRNVRFHTFSTDCVCTSLSPLYEAPFACSLRFARP